MGVPNVSPPDRIQELEAEVIQLTAVKEGLEKALKETQENFAALGAELDGGLEGRLDAEKERDVLREETDVLKQKLRRKMTEIWIAALAIIIPGCFAVYLFVLHDPGRGIREGMTVASTMETHLQRYARQVARKDTQLLKKDLEVNEALEKAKELDGRIKGLEGQVVVAQVARREAVTALKRLQQDKQANVGRRSTDMTDLEASNARAIRSLDVESEKMTIKIDKLEKTIDGMNKTKGIVIPVLIAALDHNNIRTRLGVSRALLALTGKRYRTNQDRWKDWWNTHKGEYTMEDED